MLPVPRWLCLCQRNFLTMTRNHFDATIWPSKTRVSRHCCDQSYRLSTGSYSASSRVRINSPLLTKAAGRLAYYSLAANFRTLKLELHTSEVNPYDSLGPNRHLFSIWHDSAVIASFGGKHQRTVALTSCHRDGDFVASIMGSMGVNVVRGSTGRNGGAAARKLLRVAEQHDIVITPDGPRGPRRKISKGIVYLASRTGSRIVPTAFACSNAWDIKGNWTTLTIPKPYSRVVLLAGDAMDIPPNLADGGVSLFTNLLQQSMDNLNHQAVRQLRSSHSLEAMQTESFAKAA